MISVWSLPVAVGIALGLALKRDRRIEGQPIGLYFDGFAMSWPETAPRGVDHSPLEEAFSAITRLDPKSVVEGIALSGFPVIVEAEGLLDDAGMLRVIAMTLDLPPGNQSELHAMQLELTTHDRTVLKERGLLPLFNAQIDAFLSLLHNDARAAVMRRIVFDIRDDVAKASAWCIPSEPGDMDEPEVRIQANPISASAVTHELSHCLDNLIGTQESLLLANGRILNLGQRQSGGEKLRPRFWASTEMHVPNKIGGVARGPLADFSRIVRPLYKKSSDAVTTGALRRRWAQAGLPTSWLIRLQQGECPPLGALLEEINLPYKAGVVWSWIRSSPVTHMAFPDSVPEAHRGTISAISSFLRNSYPHSLPEPPSEDELLNLSWERALERSCSYYTSGQEIFARAYEQVAWHRARAAGMTGGWDFRPGFVDPVAVPLLGALLCAALLQEHLPVCTAWEEEARAQLGAELESLDLASMPDLEQQAKAQEDG